MDSTLEKVYRAGLRFLVPLTPEETYQIIVEEAKKLVKGEYGSILLEQQGELQRVYANDEAFYKVKPRKRGYIYIVYKTRRPIILDGKALGRIHLEIKNMDVRSDIIVPLSYRNKSIGVLTILSSKNSHFSEKELNILKLFVPMASLAIRKTQLHDEMKKALELRDVFISMAAHELRTPLTTISGYIQLLYNRMAGEKSSESRWVEELSWESQRLNMLVNELLEVSQIKNGELSYVLKECNLGAIISRAIVGLQFTYPRHKVIFYNFVKKENHDLIIGDFDKLLQVFNNVLENAAKYSEIDQNIEVSLHEKNKFLVTSVTDYGKGIAKKDLPNIFEGFYRSKSAHQREGMGIGLYLAEDIVTRHKGLIKAKSKINKGTLIEIKLPKSRHKNP